MVRVAFTVEIERPAAVVFAYLTDIEKLPEWQSSAVEARTDGPLAKGARIDEVRTFAGLRRETTLEVTAFEPPTRLSLRSRGGPLNFTVEHTLEEADGRTALHVVGEGEPGGMLRLAGPMVERLAEQELRNDFRRLKEILESQ